VNCSRLAPLRSPQSIGAECARSRGTRSGGAANAAMARDVCHGDQVASRAMVMQHKTQRPVQFEITPITRDAVQKWIKLAGLKSEDFLFPSRIHDSPHLGTRQYARILEGWVEELGLDPAEYGTHSMRRTKATLIYWRTKNLRAVQLLLGHSKLDYLPCRTMSRTCLMTRSAAGNPRVHWTLQ